MKNLGIDEMHSELFSRMNQLEVEFHTEIEKTRNRENEILSRIDRMNKTSGSFQYYQKYGFTAGVRKEDVHGRHFSGIGGTSSF